jgi:hypothetical protein
LRHWRSNAGPDYNQREEKPPNFPSFLPNFSKDSFGGFVEYQGLTRLKKHFDAIPNFFLRPAPILRP